MIIMRTNTSSGLQDSLCQKKYIKIWYSCKWKWECEYKL